MTNQKPAAAAVKSGPVNAKEFVAAVKKAKMKKQISENVIQRLPKYYRYLKELTDNKISRVSSKTISEALNLTASQVRQDLYQFGGFGQQGYDLLKQCLVAASLQAFLI